MATSRRPRPRPPARAGVAKAPPRTSTSPLRDQVEAASGSWLVRLSSVPRWVVFLAFAALAIGTTLAPSWWGAGCAAVLAGVLGWLLFLAAPRLTPGQRLVRLLVIGLIVGFAAFRVLDL